LSVIPGAPYSGAGKDCTGTSTNLSSRGDESPGARGNPCRCNAGCRCIYRRLCPGIVTEEMVRSMNRDAIVLPWQTRYRRSGRMQRSGWCSSGRDRKERLCQPDQQCARVPGHIPRCPGCPGTRISDEMKIAAAHAIAASVPRPHRDHILPTSLTRM